MKAVPFVCPKCKDTEDYYGILVFPNEEGELLIPECPNHKQKDGTEEHITLVPAR